MNQFSFLDRPPAPAPPAAPFVRSSKTSQAAAEAMLAHLGRIEKEVLDAITAAGQGGLTDEEVARQTGERESTTRARRVELVEKHRVRNSGRTRPTSSGRQAIVWIAATAAVAPSPPHPTPLRILGRMVEAFQLA